MLKVQTGKEEGVHPDVLLSKDGLARAYTRCFRSAEAAELCKSILYIRGQPEGMKDLDALQSIDTLAEALSGLGQLNDSAQWLEVALAARRRILGFEHPHTLRNMHKLGIVYGQLGRVGEAREMQLL